MARPFVKMHDAWVSDPKIGRLISAQRYDAVVLFWALVAHSHAHDTDGCLGTEDVRSVCRSCSIRDPRASMRALRASELVRIRDRTVTEIVAYRRWQTTSDQRESHADRMRTSRSRDSARDSLERKKERKKARATHVPQGDDDSPWVVSLQKAAQERIAELERRERGT